MIVNNLATMMVIMQPVRYFSISLSVLVIIFTQRFSLAAEGTQNFNLEDTLPQTEAPVLSPEIPVTIEKKDTPSAKQVRSKFKQVIKPAGFGIQGVKTLAFEEVSRFFQPYVNQEVTIGELVLLANKVTQLYQQKGYPLAFCLIPNQDFNNKRIRVVVVEGYVSEIEISGNPGKSVQKIHDIAGHLMAERPLTRETMERYSRMLSTLPGIQVKAALPLPIRENGATQLQINVKRKPVDLTGRTEFVEPYTRAIVTTKANGNLGLAEDVAFSAMISKDDEEYYAGSYVQPIGSDGLMFRFDVSSYDGRRNSTLGDDIVRDTETIKFSSGLSYPFVLKKFRSLTGNVSFNVTDFKDTLRNTANNREVSSVTDTRSLTLGLTHTDHSAVDFRRAQLALTQGINALGAEHNAFDLTQRIDLDFTKVMLDFMQRNFFGVGWQTTFSASGTYSENPLPITERVIFGGYRYGRAFKPGEIAGDSGFGLSFEVGKIIPYPYEMPFYDLAGFQPYVLIETAHIFEDTKTNAKDDISSFSLGIKMLNADPTRNNLDFSLSQPIGGGGRDFFENLTFGFNFGLSL